MPKLPFLLSAYAMVRAYLRSQLYMLRGEAWLFCGRYDRALQQFSAAARAGFALHAGDPAASVGGCWGTREPLDRSPGAAVARALKYRALLSIWCGRFIDGSSDTKTAVNIDPELEGGVALMRDMQRFQFPPEHPQHLPVQFPSAPPRMEYCSAEQQAGWAELEDGGTPEQDIDVRATATASSGAAGPATQATRRQADRLGRLG
jgi:hypothetical protein